jgi:hypothetical protein
LSEIGDDDRQGRSIRDLDGFLGEVNDANLVASLGGERLNFSLQVLLHDRRLHRRFAVGKALVEVLAQAEAVGVALDGQVVAGGDEGIDGGIDVAGIETQLADTSGGFPVRWRRGP